jgi:putative thioredoxin
MLPGSQKTTAAAPPQDTKTSGQQAVFDATTADFEDRVLRASLEKPVIVDFWAPWCGPCKQLGPILESAVNATNGAVLMAKVNIDENPELAQALRVQSIPTVYAFFQGRPVDAFQGAQPESTIKTFVQKLLTLAKQGAPDAIDIPAALKAAAQALAEGDLGAAQGIYAQILSQDEKNVAAFIGLIRVLIAGDQVKQAAAMIASAPPEISRSPLFGEARTALELAQTKTADSGKLAKKLDKNPADHQLRLDLAVAQFAEGEREQAAENLLTIIRTEREWNDSAAKKQLLKFFEAMGASDPVTIAARKKLSSILFS